MFCKLDINDLLWIILAPTPPPDRFQWMNNLSRIWILRSAEAGQSGDAPHNIRSQDITLYIIHSSLFNHALFTIASVNITYFTFPIPLRVINCRWSQVFAQARARQKFYKMCPEPRSSARTEEARVNKFQCLPFLYSEPDTKLVKRQRSLWRSQAVIYYFDQRILFSI